MYHVIYDYCNGIGLDYDLIYEKQEKCIVGIVAHVFDALGGWSTGGRF